MIIMTGKELTKKVKSLKAKMNTKRTNGKATLSDLKILVACKEIGEYSQMYNTKLYTLHGGEYCEYLQLLG